MLKTHNTYNLYKISLFLVFIFIQQVVSAETAYITDHFTVTLRSGESARHRVVAILQTGDEVNLVSTNPQSGYAKVRLKNGKEGYILARQLKKEPIARHQLRVLEKNTNVPGTVIPSHFEPNDLRKQYADLQAAYQQLTQQKIEVEAELAKIKRTSADVLRVMEERNQLREQTISLIRHNEVLKQDKLEISNAKQQRWFLLGAGAVILGILMGFIMPRLSTGKRKNTAWGSSL